MSTFKANPGDTIVTDNGSKFICVSPDTTDRKRTGYNYQPTDILAHMTETFQGFQDWDETGKPLFYTSGYYATTAYEYSIREIIPCKAKPPRIYMDKKYQTRSGKPVTVLTVTRNHVDFPVVVMYGDVDINAYNKYGTFNWDGTEHELDLIEYKSPFTDLPVDTLIWVDGVPRYFESYDEKTDKVNFFIGGRTSKTTEHFASLCIDATKVSLTEPVL